MFCACLAEHIQVLLWSQFRDFISLASVESWSFQKFFAMKLHIKQFRFSTILKFFFILILTSYFCQLLYKLLTSNLTVKKNNRNLFNQSDNNVSLKTEFSTNGDSDIRTEWKFSISKNYPQEKLHSYTTAEQIRVDLKQPGEKGR